MDGTNSPTCIVVNFAEKLVLIGWTAYSTFFAADESRWQVERLDVKKFRPPVIEEDPHNIEAKRELHLLRKRAG